MNFKVRTYKKTGSHRGNKDQEFFFDKAETALEKYEELFRKEDYSLNPTLWAFSGEADDWVRHSENDFRNYFTEGKRRIDITKESVNCCNELVVNTEKGCVEAYYELWCDVDQYFGTDTRKNESIWIDFYTMWHPDGRITAIYIIDSDDSSEEFNWSLTDQEQEFFRRKMEKYCMQTEKISLQQLYATEKEFDDLYVKAEKNGFTKEWLKKAISNFIQSFNLEEWNGNKSAPENSIPDLSHIYKDSDGNIFQFSIKRKGDSYFYQAFFKDNLKMTERGIIKNISNGENNFYKETYDLLLLSSYSIPDNMDDPYYIELNGKKYLLGPLSVKTIRKYKDEHDHIQGVVELHMSDLIDNGYESFRDQLSKGLINTNLLQDIDYQIIGLSPDVRNTLYILVSGDVSFLDHVKRTGW